MLNNFDDFVRALLSAGFSMGGGNAEGIYAAVPFSWDNEPEGSPIRWHTGDPATDPWEWRMRVLEERDDIAYAKCFFKKSGFIARDWYPCFLAARQALDFDGAYRRGLISHDAKKVYDALREGERPTHALKPLAGFTGKDGSAAFERALVDLQMKLYVTMQGRRQKTSATGEPYGWNSTVMTTTRAFWGDEAFREAAGISAEEAARRIAERVYELNPAANAKKIRKFILG